MLNKKISIFAKSFNMRRFYDPKTDIIFKKVFGHHAEITISFLNALLQLEGKNKITHIEYVDSDVVPITIEMRNSLVDVRCTDGNNRNFFVEMQMYWTSDFLRRVMFNASKIFVEQYTKGEVYYKKKQVYAINLINENFQNDNDVCYHHYQMAEKGSPKHIIEGIEIVCVELQKFKPENFAHKKMMRLWLRFLTEIDAKNGREYEDKLSDELLKSKEIEPALELCQNLNKQERDNYFYFWDQVALKLDREQTVKNIAHNEGMAKGYVQGHQKGREEGIAQERIEIAKNMQKLGLDLTTIAKATNLTIDELKQLL